MAQSTTKTPAKPSPASIAGETLREIIWNPGVYLPFTALAVGNAFVNIPLGMTLGAAAAVAAGQVWWWKRNWDHIFQRHEASAEKKYRKDYNDFLYQQVSLRSPAAQAIHELLQTKIDIEERILADNFISGRERELLDLLEITATQATEAAEEAKGRKIPEEITEALETMKELQANLDFVLRPLSPTETEAQEEKRSGLAQSTQTLRHRMEEAKGVRRMVEDMESPRKRTQA